MIKVQHLWASFNSFQLKDINLEINKGAHFILLGTSGAGKNLLIETILGLRPYNKGKIQLETGSIAANRNNLSPISYVPQDLAIFPHLSIIENITFGAKIRKINKEIIKKKVDELAELLNIGHLLQRSFPDTLSIGEKQRVALARALIIEPQILFLDEPFSSLDNYIKRQLIENLHQIRKQFSITIFHATHDQEETFMLADQVAVLFDGAIEQVGAPADLQKYPANLKIARLLMAQNIFDGQIAEIDREKSTMSVRTGNINLVSPVFDGFTTGQDVSIVIRPEEIHIIRPNRPLGPKMQDNLFEAYIERTIQNIGRQILRIHINGLEQSLEVSLTNCAFNDMELKAGKIVRVCLQSESLWFIPKIL